MRVLLILILFIPLSVLAKNKEDDKDLEDTKYKSFITFNGSSSFLKNDTKYFNVSFGIKAKCKYKFGFNYGWLRGSLKTDDYAVDFSTYPDASSTTRTNAKFYSLLFEPILIKGSKVNISTPINFGLTDLESEYQKQNNSYVTYFEGNPFFSSVALDMDFRILAIMKIGFRIGYQMIFTDFEVAKNELSTPFIGFGVKIGRMCK